MNGLDEAFANVIVSLLPPPTSEAGGPAVELGVRVAHALAQGLMALDARDAHRGALDACAWLRTQLQGGLTAPELYEGPVIGWPETLALFVRLAELARALIAVSKCNEPDLVSPALFARARVRMAVEMITGDATCSPQPAALAALAVLDRTLGARIVETIRMLGNSEAGLAVLKDLEGLDVGAEQLAKDLRGTLEGTPPNVQPFMLPPPPARPE